jgi:hypothetical protein
MIGKIIEKNWRHGLMNIEPSIYNLVVEADKNCKKMVKTLKECQASLDRMSKLVNELEHKKK